jgi:ATP-dependent Clp protease protease subunit
MLNTQGGNVIDGLALYDMIKETQKSCPVTIIACGNCMSMGVILMQAATTRKAMSHSYFMMHEIASEVGGKLSSMEDDVKFSQALQAVLNGILSERSGQPVKKLAKLFERKDFYVNAHDAKKFNLIDEVIKE